RQRRVLRPGGAAAGAGGNDHRTARGHPCELIGAGSGRSYEPLGRGWPWLWPSAPTRSSSRPPGRSSARSWSATPWCGWRCRCGAVDVANERYFFLLCVLAAAVAFGATLRIGRGKTGRALLTVRTSRTAAEALAVDSVRYRTLAFVVSGCLASGAGVLLGTLIQSSRSNPFTLFAS